MSGFLSRAPRGLAVVGLLSMGSLARGGVTASGVVASSQLDPNHNNLSAPTGLLDGDTGFTSGLNPFNPPYDSSQILIVKAGGSITMKLSSPVPGTGQIGVFTNTGLLNTSAPVATASSPAATLGQPSQAIVSVSSDNVNFFPLFQNSVVALDAPSNYWLDATVTGASAGGFFFADQGLGTAAANQFQPFDLQDSTTAPVAANDPLRKFSGLTYDQMLNLLNGSAGGTWFDLAGSNLASVQYIKFDVPAGDRLVLDSISATPEPGSLALLLVMGSLGLGRRRHG